MTSQSSATSASKLIEHVRLEDHVCFWEEARFAKRHYFLTQIDLEKANIKNWLTYNSRYFYDIRDVPAIKELYVDFCNSLLSIRLYFDYEGIGTVLQFLISDTRFHLKPFDLPKYIGVIRETYLLLTTEWDKIVLKTFPFAYKTILSGRYEVKEFLLYLTLEGCAHGIVSPKATLSIVEVMTSFLACLELPMSLYFDSFHLRKLLFKMSKEGAPAFSIHCLHPILTQVQYIFLNYYSCIERAILLIDEIKHLQWRNSGFRYLLQSFLVDNYHQMIYWKPVEYVFQLEEVIKPVLVQMLTSEMPIIVINKLLIQGFYDMIEGDCGIGLVKTFLTCILVDINNWQHLVGLWNEGIMFHEFRTSSSRSLHPLHILTIFFYVSIEIKSVKEGEICIQMIQKFILKRVKTSAHAEIILKFLSIYPWDFSIPLHPQIEHWFEDLIVQNRDAGFDDNTLAGSFSEADDEGEIPMQSN